MDKQRYIVGDLISYKREIKEIKETDDIGDYIIVIPPYKTKCLFFEEIEPIPLTPAILEKNGWKDYFKGSIWKELATKRAYLYITKDQTTEDEYLVCCGRSKCNLASIKYVHQLQHLLFGLGINSEMEV